MSPYQKVLKQLKERKSIVRVERADASDVVGEVENADLMDGFSIKVFGGHDIERYVYVAYRDIRGVGCTDWNFV